MIHGRTCFVICITNIADCCSLTGLIPPSFSKLLSNVKTILMQNLKYQYRVAKSVFVVCTYQEWLVWSIFNTSVHIIHIKVIAFKKNINHVSCQLQRDWKFSLDLFLSMCSLNVCNVSCKCIAFNEDLSCLWVPWRWAKLLSAWLHKLEPFPVRARLQGHKIKARTPGQAERLLI